MIEVRSLRKSFDGFTALDGLDISVPDGAVYGLVGPNGAGKSTLIRHLAGILRQDEGEVLYDGEAVFENPAVKAQIAYIPDEVFYYPGASVKDMMLLYRRMYPSFSEERYNKLAPAFGIAPERSFKRLSKGMQKQAAFWLALSLCPRYMLLDEPLDGLDPVMRRQVMKLLLADVAERGTTVLVSSHNLRELEDVCDHVGIMNRGRMLLQRPLCELQDSTVKVQLALPDDRELPDGLEILHKSVTGRLYQLILRGTAEEVTNVLAAAQPFFIDVLPLTLEEIFMSWEALTVRSKISFFNKHVALNLLKRFWPLWTAYFAAMIFVFPVNLLSKLHFNLRGSLLEMYGVNRQVLQTCRLEFPVTFVFAVLIAMAVFSYLYDTRRCGLANSLPLRRETMYCTAFITGLAPMLIADLLVWAAAWIILAGTPNVIARYMLIRLATSLMCSTAFFGLAAFCAALTGNLLVLPVLYGVINIAAVLLERAVEALLSVLVYGYAYDGSVLDFLSPVKMLFYNYRIESTAIPGAADGAYTYSVSWLGYLTGFCIVGIALAALGLVIIRRRRMELAGDVVAVSWLRPAFKYCMAIGGALTFACAVYYWFFDYVLYGVPAAVLVIAMLTVGAFIGWFGSEMLMQKTLRVFSKGWKQYAAVCCALMALALCAELDVTGYEKYIPPLDEIDYINFSEGSTGHENQPETLELYREFHQKLIDSKSLPNRTDGDYYIEPLNYYLKDGTHVCRLYRLPYSDGIESDPDSAIGALDRLLNCPELIAQRVYPSIPVTEESISTAYLTVENIGDDGSYLNDTVRLTPAQAYELYTECIVPDAEDGTIGLRFASDTEEIRLRTTNVWIYMEMSEFVGRSANVYGDYVYDYISLDLYTNSARTYKWITDNTNIEPTDGYQNINYGKY